MPDWPIIAGALWLGILTSISPCPLATNIASVAFLARRSTQRKAIIGSGLFYILGRMTAYTLLASVITAGLLSAPSAAEFFRDKLEGLIGPALLILGGIVSGLIRFKIPGLGNLNSLGTQLSERGFIGEFLMGAIFALAFCPVSAALFFGGLLTAVMSSGSSIVLPIVYGIGTAIPVIVAVIMIAGGLSVAGRKIEILQSLGAKLQIITGAILILVGAWITLRGVLA